MPGQPGQSPPVLISPPKKVVIPSNARNPYPTKNDGANPTRNVQTPNSVIPTKLCHPDRNRSSQSDDLWSGGTLCLTRSGRNLGGNARTARTVTAGPHISPQKSCHSEQREESLPNQE